MVKTIIFTTTPDQMTSLILAMNAATFAVNFLPFSRLIVGLSPGTFRVHTKLVVNLRVDLARIPLIQLTCTQNRKHKIGTKTDCNALVS